MPSCVEKRDRDRESREWAAGRAQAAARANIEEIFAFADGADRLMRGERTFSPASLALFETWRDVQEYAASYAGRDLLPILQIIDREGTANLRDMLSRASLEAEADIVVSTIHRAKGLEWNREKVCGDFRFKTDDDGRTTLTDEEKRLLYVGLNREALSYHLEYAVVVMC